MDGQLGPDARRVLIVDDEPIILKALDKFLGRYHFEILQAEHAVDAIRILRETTVGVIITDYQMPMLSGLEFLQQVKKIQPLATRILITAIQDNETVIKAINDGEIFRFIPKPWKGDDLLATVNNAAQRFDLAQKNELLQAATQKANSDLQNQLQVIESQKQEFVRLNNSLRHAIENSVKLCVKAVETFKPDLGGRARKVQALSMAIGSELQLEAEATHNLSIASLLHEIGLLSIPPELIEKAEKSPSQMSEPEVRAYHHHPVVGEELTSYIDESGIIPAIIRSHCEHFDGSGFPDGLNGNFIPQAAAIIAVASFVVKSRNNLQTTLEILNKSAGRRFDPEIVRAAVRAINALNSQRAAGKKPVLISELKPGMVLANSIMTSEGTLLLPDGEVLTEASIKLIANHDRLTSVTGEIFISS